MSKESEYIFIKLSSKENYKKWVREIVFALKDLALWRYVNGIIIKLAFLKAKTREMKNQIN